MTKLFKSIVAIAPVKLSFIALFVFFLLYIFVFLDNSNILCVNSINGPVGKFLNKYSPVPVSTEKVPLAQNHPNVISSGYFYNVGGNVEQITSDSVKLRTRGSALPIFKISPEVQVYKVIDRSKPSVPAKLSDIKVGTLIVVSASFRSVPNAWRVDRLTIDEKLEFPPSSR